MCQLVAEAADQGFVGAVLVARGDEILLAEGYGTLHDGPLSPVPSIFDDVFEEQDWRLVRQRQDLGV